MEEGRGQQEGGKGRREGGRQVGGEYGVREGGSVGRWDGGRKITAGQGGMKRK